MTPELQQPSEPEVRRDAAVSMKRPARILFLIDRLHGVGGAENMVLEMTRRLPGRGMSCELATIDPDPHILDLFPCPVHMIPFGRFFSPRAFGGAWKLAGIIRERRIDIVQTFFATSDLWGGMVTKALTGARLVSSQRDDGHTRSANHRRLYRVIHPLFDQVHAVSAETRMASRQFGWPLEKIETVHNGLDLERFDRRAAESPREQMRRQLGIAAGVPLIAAAGGVRREKGYDVLADAARLVCKRHREATFAIAGDLVRTAFVAELRERIAAHGLGANIRLLDQRDDIPALLAAADIYCSASHTEGFSNALIEGMAASLPCVVTRVGGNAEAVTDGVNGFLTPPGGAEALARALLGCLDDPERAAAMGREARRTVESRFTMEAMVARLVTLYNRLLADR